MDTPRSFSSDQSMVIQLEVASDDEQPADIADVDEVGRSLFDQLTQNSYTVKPASTGRKGGLLFTIVVSIAQFVHDNKDWLQGVLDGLLIVLAKRAEDGKAKQPPFKITLEINGKPVVIEVNNEKDAKKLIDNFRMNQNDKVKIKVDVPKKKLSKKRRHS